MSTRRERSRRLLLVRTTRMTMSQKSFLRPEPVSKFWPIYATSTVKGRFNALPGFRLTMGFSLFYISLVVLIPIIALFLRAFEMKWHDFVRVVTEDRALAAY